MVPGTCLARRFDREYVAGMAGASEHADTGADGDEPVYLEPRWPIALVLSLFIALTIVIRALQAHRESLLNPWIVPGVEIALLAALIAADPLHVGRRSKWLRRVGIVLVLCLVTAALVATAVLVADLVRGGKVTESASTLLTSGVLIWLGNCLAFGLLYWLLDSGGPLARYRHERPYPDFAFSQQLNPELARPGWRPRYVDYLILGVTTSTAFSPTDVMPMSAWAKLTMALQSIVSLLVIGLVIARAVNVFT
jgi:hypothetical protein